jgi:glycosyltransferase involved in cell wall biosynthesis
VALVWWGRQGSLATLRAIAEALDRDGRFGIAISQSRQSDERLDFPGATLLPVDTFTGFRSLLLRTPLAPLIAGRMVRQLHAHGVRAIVTVMTHVWGVALERAARRAGIATILIVHDADPHPGERRPVFDWLARVEIRRSDRIVTLSNHVADRLLARGDVTEARLTRLFHPILRFGAASPRQDSSRPFRLLFFGRILPYKGVELLLEAYRLLRDQGVDCVLRVVGRGDIDAPAALLNQPGLTIAQGWVPQEAIGGILAWADAVVLPYREASQSGVVAGAYGAGLPVVGTPVGGLTEQIVSGETGLLADAVDAAALARAIRRLIETPGLYARCRAGVAAYHAAHTPDEFAHTLARAILQTIGPAAAGDRQETPG